MYGIENLTGSATMSCKDIEALNLRVKQLRNQPRINFKEILPEKKEQYVNSMLDEMGEDYRKKKLVQILKQRYI